MSGFDAERREKGSGDGCAQHAVWGFAPGESEAPTAVARDLVKSVIVLFPCEVVRVRGFSLMELLSG